MSDAPPAPAATFVIFGVMGDLTGRLLVPAIANLARDGLLDAATRLLGIGQQAGDDEMLRAHFDTLAGDDGSWPKVRDRVMYLSGDFTERTTFEALGKRIEGNVVFYLATAAQFFGPIVELLGEAGLLDEAEGFRRVVIEKPFGHDLASAQALNLLILARIGEGQVYRIDHFLGKETVQNIMVARFGNSMFEAVLNSRYVDHVQITAAEAMTIGTRGKSYDVTGALRDMVPNHLFQLLAMIGMEPPISFDADAIRTEKAKLLAAISPIDPTEAVRGRYAAGTVNGTPVARYVDEADVDPAGRTETFVALKLNIETWRWSGVPFYLRTGKALTARDTEIVIQFHDVPLALFRETVVDRLPPNRLVMQIQPVEGLGIEFVVKQPGQVVNTAPVSMDFRYADRFAVGHQTGYETLLYDVLTGDQTLFQRADQIESSWRAVQPLLDTWQQGTPEDYAPGSTGPESAAALMHRSHRRWHPLG